MSREKNSVLVIYAPVWHRGHEQLLARFESVKRLYLLDGRDLVRQAPTHKDLHALDIELIRDFLLTRQRFERIEILTPLVCDQLQAESVAVIASDDEVAAYLRAHGISDEKITVSPVFLRWTRAKALQKTTLLPSQQATTTDVRVQKIMHQAQALGQGSSDFWRQVGAILQLASGGQLQAFNQHLPEHQTPYIVGDIRGQFHRGRHWELGSSLHAEAGVIALAACQGVSTAGATLWVTDFPCPNCAKLIAAAGIKKLYYHQGYNLIDGEAILRAAGVDIIQVLL